MFHRSGTLISYRFEQSKISTHQYRYLLVSLYVYTVFFIEAGNCIGVD